MPLSGHAPDTHPKLAELRVLILPNQSSVARAFLDFEEAGNMKSLDFFASVVDAMKELIKLALLTGWSDKRVIFFNNLIGLKTLAADFLIG